MGFGCTGSDDQKGTAVPFWREAKMPFYREEEDGLWMVMPAKHPRPHFLNTTAAFVLQRCDGKHDIFSLVFELSREYPSVPFSRLEMDTINCLYFLETLGFIHWDDEAFLRDHNVGEMQKGIRFTVASERDFGRISAFVNRYFEELKEKGNQNHLRLVTPTENAGGNYQDIAVRTRQFRLMESFFCLEREGELVGVSSIRIAAMGFHLGSFVLIAPGWSDTREEIMRELIQKTLFFLQNQGIFRIRLPLIPSTVDERIRNFLQGLGFSEEAILRDELGKGQDLALWSRRLL